MARRRLGPATIDVLQAIAAGQRYGFEIMEATGLPGGTVYPALAALERDALVSSSWEDPLVAQADKRPPRRYYDLARRGRLALQAEVQRLRRLSGIVDEGAPPEPGLAPRKV